MPKNLDKIEREKERLMDVFQGLPAEKLTVADGLIIQAAWQRVQLDEMQDDLEANGWVEQFQQSERCSPYERERPTAAQYIKLNKNYQSTVKMLLDMVPAAAETSRLEELMKL